MIHPPAHPSHLSCDIYAGLFGRDYGSEDAEGVSPTERSRETTGKPPENHQKPRSRR